MYDYVINAVRMMVPIELAFKNILLALCSFQFLYCITTLRRLRILKVWMTT